MILEQKKNLDPQLHEELKKYVYDIIGHVMYVCKQLPCGQPEYLYQEAFAKTLRKNGIDPHKEHQYHPLFDGEPLEAYLKMDFMIEREWGQLTPNREQCPSSLEHCRGAKEEGLPKQANIVVEAKAIDKLTNHERAQLFGYLVGTGYPVGLLVNFATYPHPTIERYYFDKKDMTITAF